MALLAELGAQLVSAGLASSSGAGGYMLLLSWLPDSSGLQDQVVALSETPNSEPPWLGVELDRPTVRVTVRGQSLMQASSAYPDAYDRAQSVKLAFQELVFTSSSGRYLPGVVANSDPFLLGIDALRRPIVVCDFQVWRSRT